MLMPACPSTMPMANPFVSRNATGAVDVVPAKTSTSLSLFSLTLLPVRKCRLATDRVPVRISLRVLPRRVRVSNPGCRVMALVMRIAPVVLLPICSTPAVT